MISFHTVVGGFFVVKDSVWEESVFVKESVIVEGYFVVSGFTVE